MAIRTASAEWQGGVQDGKGTIASATGAVDGQYSYSSRFEEGPGTTPEELIAAAHASCFSMALSFDLANAGHVVDSVRTEANVHLLKDGDGFAIKRITLTTVGRVPGIDAAGIPGRRRGRAGRLPDLEGARRGRDDRARGDARELEDDRVLV